MFGREEKHNKTIKMINVENPMPNNGQKRAG